MIDGRVLSRLVSDGFELAQKNEIEIISRPSKYAESELGILRYLDDVGLKYTDIPDTLIRDVLYLRESQYVTR